MYRTFGQIPVPSAGAASAISDAARHVENLLYHDPDREVTPDSDQFPRPGREVVDTDGSDEVVEGVDPSSMPNGENQDEERHEGAVGGVIDTGIEYLAFYKSFRNFLKAPAPKRWGIFFIRKRCVALATDMSPTLLIKGRGELAAPWSR